MELKIEEIAYGGDGVARWNGKVVFVPGVMEGEVVRARIVENRGSYSRAEVEEILAPSPLRRDAPCPYFGKCGGCAYQHMPEPEQRRVKELQVASLLRRVAGIPQPEVRKMISAGAPFEYRNRITVRSDGRRMGFHARRSNHLVDVASCLLAEPRVNEMLKQWRKSAGAATVKTLRRPGQGRVFYQVNEAVADEMATFVGHQIADPVPRFLDAYCGAGFFLKKLRPYYQEGFGIEVDPHAVAEARRHLGGGTRIFQEAVETKLEEILGGVRPDVMLLDPPAAGIGKGLARLLADAGPGRLFYVSCDPATLARDLRVLLEGYRLACVQPFDMFPQTAAIEVVTVLQRKGDAR